MKKNKIGAIFLVLSLIFLLIPSSLNITDNVIAENISVVFNFFYILGLIFFSSSMIIFASRQNLDAIIIPTGGGEWDSEKKMYSQDRDRTQKAVEERDQLKKKGYFLISGYVPKGKENKRVYKGSQTQDIYRELRKYGIKPSEMRIEPQARNTIENVVYSLKKVKKRGGRDVGIVSYPGHLDRFEDIIERGKKEGIIDKNFEIHRIPTRYKETPKEKAYEFGSRLLNRYKLRQGVKEALDSEDDPFVKFLKRSKNFIVNLISGKK